MNRENRKGKKCDELCAWEILKHRYRFPNVETTYLQNLIGSETQGAQRVIIQRGDKTEMQGAKIWDDI